MLGKHWRRRSAHTRIATYPSLPPIPSPPRRPCARRGPAPQITSKPIPHHRLVAFSVAFATASAFSFALPRAPSVPGRTRRASPRERLRREAKAGRGLSDEGGARRVLGGDVRA